jgi:hypothetical protein
VLTFIIKARKQTVQAGEITVDCHSFLFIDNATDALGAPEFAA